MNKPTIQENTLKGDYPSAIIWQESEEGAPEPAIFVRTYPGIVEIQGPYGYVNINPETIPDLCKLLKRFASA